MSFGLAVNGGTPGNSFTYADTSDLFAGVLLKQQFVEINEAMSGGGAYATATVDFTGEAAGFTDIAVIVMPAGAALIYGDTNTYGNFYYYGGYRGSTKWINCHPPTVTRSGNVVTIQANTWMFSKNDFAVTAYHSYNVMVIGVK